MARKVMAIASCGGDFANYNGTLAYTYEQLTSGKVIQRTKPKHPLDDVMIECKTKGITYTIWQSAETCALMAFKKENNSLSLEKLREKYIRRYMEEYANV